MKELLKEMHAWMDAYMKSFHTDDEEVMQGIKIKEIHTGYVTSIAVQLAKHLPFSEHDVELAEIMGLFHDVGRFRQYSTRRSTMRCRRTMRTSASRSCRSSTS